MIWRREFGPSATSTDPPDKASPPAGAESKRSGGGRRASRLDFRSLPCSSARGSTRRSVDRFENVVGLPVLRVVVEQQSTILFELFIKGSTGQGSLDTQLDRIHLRFNNEIEGAFEGVTVISVGAENKATNDGDAVVVDLFDGLFEIPGGWPHVDFLAKAGKGFILN